MSLTKKIASFVGKINEPIDLKSNKKGAAKNKAAVSPVRKKTAKAPSDRADTAKSPVKPAELQGENKPTAVKPRSISEDKVIKDFASVPSYSYVCSGPTGTGQIVISDARKKDFIALSIDRPLKRVVIVQSVESAKVRSDPGAVPDLIQKIKDKGGEIQKVLFASRSLIRLLYENDSAKSSSHEVIEDAEGFKADFDDLVEMAMKQKTSDIHIEVNKDRARARIRVDGDLQEFKEYSVPYAKQFCRVIYQVIAEEKEVLFNPEVQQSAVIDRSIGGSQVRIRVNTMKTYPNGFDFVMRILEISANINTDISTLDYTEVQTQGLEHALSRPAGAIIVAGSTGSGKTTTLATLINSSITRFTYNGQCRIKVITVEDPPEIFIPNASQNPVIRSKNKNPNENPFAESILSALRCDPDMLMIGEIRDAQSAELLVHGTQSGHQVLTTLHGTSALGMIGRLRSLGISDNVIGSNDFLSGLVYQALVPVVCQHCSHDINTILGIGSEIQIKSAKTLIDLFGEDATTNVRYRNHTGCSHCRDGKKGRAIIAEVIVPDSYMRDLMADQKDNELRKYWLANGGKPVVVHAAERALAGRCCPIDAQVKGGPFEHIKELQEHFGLNISGEESSPIVTDMSKIEGGSKSVVSFRPRENPNEKDK